MDQQPPQEDPRVMEIPDGLTFGLTPSTWRLAVSPNRQFVFVVLRTPSIIFSVPFDKAGVRKLGQALLDLSDQLMDQNNLMLPPTPPKDLLIPQLNTDAILKRKNGQ